MPLDLSPGSLCASATEILISIALLFGLDDAYLFAKEITSQISRAGDASPSLTVSQAAVEFIIGCFHTASLYSFRQYY